MADSNIVDHDNARLGLRVYPDGSIATRAAPAAAVATLNVNIESSEGFLTQSLDHLSASIDGLAVTLGIGFTTLHQSNSGEFDRVFLSFVTQTDNNGMVTVEITDGVTPTEFRIKLLKERQPINLALTVANGVEVRAKRDDENFVSVLGGVIRAGAIS